MHGGISEESLRTACNFAEAKTMPPRLIERLAWRGVIITRLPNSSRQITGSWDPLQLIVAASRRRAPQCRPALQSRCRIGSRARRSLNAYIDASVLLEALVEQPASAAVYADMLSQSGVSRQRL